MKLSSKLIAFCSVPFLAAVVAIHQLYYVETSELSRWKGGGFGMYTTIHEFYDIIVINNEVIIKDQLENNRDFEKTKHKFLFNPNSSHLTDLLAILKTTYDVDRLQIYRPVVDPNTNILSYKVRYDKEID